MSQDERAKAMIAFQVDADIYRLKHVKHYSELLQKYNAKTGKYPFQGDSELPTYVFVANDAQKLPDGQNPNPHKVKSYKEFALELRKAVGDFEQLFDPQYVANKKPNFYIYMIIEDQFFFAVHVSQDYPFAKKIADGYYKVEVSNKPESGAHLHSTDNLLSNKAFIEAMNKTPRKPSFFEQRAMKHKNFVSTDWDSDGPTPLAAFYSQ